MRLIALALVVALTTPGVARAQDEEDELAPLAPLTPKQPKRTKKATPPAAAKPAPPVPTQPARRDDPPALDLSEPAPVEPRKPAAPPAEPRSAPPATASTPDPAYEDPDLTAATQVKKSVAPLSTVGWIATGIGAAALVTGAIVGGLAASARSGLAVDGRGVVVSGDPEQAAATVRLSRLSSGLLISGGIAAAGGLLLALWPSSSPARSALKLIPTADSQSASLFLQGVWP